MPNKHTSPRSGDEATWLDHRDLPRCARFLTQHIEKGAAVTVHHRAETIRARLHGRTDEIPYRAARHLTTIRERYPLAIITEVHA